MYIYIYVNGGAKHFIHWPSSVGPNSGSETPHVADLLSTGAYSYK